MQKKIVVLVLLTLAVMPAAVFAGQSLVPQSGQTLCYDAAGVEIPCTGTGQDGDQQMGVPWPNPRFTDNGNGTITDNLTGLIWLKNVGCRGADYFWSNALSLANSLANGACGLTDGSAVGDWRLPNKKELESLINRQQNNPASWLNTVGFSGVSNNSYWSSSTNSGNSSNAWCINLSNGSEGSYNKTDYWIYGYVWPVRGGQ